MKKIRKHPRNPYLFLLILITSQFFFGCNFEKNISGLPEENKPLLFKTNALPGVQALTNIVSGHTINKVPGKNRLLVVMILMKSDNPESAEVSYGGQLMTKVLTKDLTKNGVTSYIGYYTLNEVGVNAANSGKISVTWTGTPSIGYLVYSALLANVTQSYSVSAKESSSIDNGKTISTAGMLAEVGDVVLMAGITEANTDQVINNGFNKMFEASSSFGDVIGGYKLGSGASEIAKFTQSANGGMLLAAITIYSQWAPIIRKQPVTSYQLPINDVVILSVEAIGDNLTYQWYKDGFPIPGATSSQYSAQITLEETTKDSYYRCEVYNHIGNGWSEKIRLAASLITDIDGNYYHEVKIGSQVWTLENWKATRFNDGTPITNLTNDDDWTGTFHDVFLTPAYCWYNNDISNKDKYGALYNGNVVQKYGKSIAPPGWRVPTWSDWFTLNLLLTLGGELEDAGGKMKTIGTSDWKSPNTGATNSSGFSALPGGYRARGFTGLGEQARWWVQHEAEVGQGCCSEYGVQFDNEFFITNVVPETMGFSIRLIRTN